MHIFCHLFAEIKEIYLKIWIYQYILVILQQNMNKSKIACIYIFFFSLLIVLLGCDFKLRPGEEDEQQGLIEVQRYDRLQSLYLQTGDFSALQQMNTSYPIETRTLIEKVLQIGSVNDPEINNKFLRFYQDTTLQTVISDVNTEFAKMDDINKSLSHAFAYLQKHISSLTLPSVYAQIGDFAQSIVVGNESVGISLDKYMGSNYPLYKRFGYTPQQLSTMTRSYIVPDCLTFYILSLYPLHDFENRDQYQRDIHMAKVMWIVNKAMGKHFFKTPEVKKVERFMHHNPSIDMESLLKRDDLEI
jgi:hypothetical protein